MGKWLVGEGNGDSFYITLEENGEATKSIGAADGTWVYVDGEARITWDDGWHDAIRKVGSKHGKFAYSPGKSFSDNPTNVTEARDTSPQPIKAAGKTSYGAKIAAKVVKALQQLRGGALVTSFWQDVRYSLRVIAKAPGFAAIVILTLALGIGANTTIFSWINARLLNPIPGLASPSEVVALSLGRPADNPFPFTYPDFEMMRDGQHSFAGLTGCNPTPMSLTGKGKPERVWGTVASANYFDVLGVRPILGRVFCPRKTRSPEARRWR